MQKKFVKMKRRSVSLSNEQLVTEQPIDAEKLGLLITPAVPGVDLVDWARLHRDKIEKDLTRYGALLFRGFEPKGIEEFQRFIATVSEDPMQYVYRSTPRSTVQGNIYTTTEYPADESIPMHNENSYQHSWPSKLFLHCADAPDEGGATPLSNSARVYERIDPAVREVFERKGVLYVRNYREFMDLPWQTVFQTDDRSEVEAFCSEAGIEAEWSDDGLRTRQTAQGCLRHPRSGEMLWFNQAHLFHLSNLKPEIQKRLLDLCGEENLPRHAYHGDGSPIDPAALEAIRRAYDEETVTAPWEVGDVAIVDNMKVAHAREPYKGTRTVVIGMTEQFSASDVDAA